MPLTDLDPATALVLVDLQYGISWMLGPAAIEGALANSARLAADFRDRGWPVILIRVDFSADGGDRPRNRVTVGPPPTQPPANWAELLPELDHQATDIVVTKRQPGAFYGTDLDLQLRRRGVTGIVLGGVMTGLGVESTGRAAYDHGYNVTFAADAMA